MPRRNRTYVVITANKQAVGPFHTLTQAYKWGKDHHGMDYYMVTTPDVYDPVVTPIKPVVIPHDNEPRCGHCGVVLSEDWLLKYGFCSSECESEYRNAED